jgi:hypothetical protein
MTLTYRTAGAWGAGKGANLTAAEVDGNTYHFAQALAGIVSGTDGVGVVGITFNGTQITFEMSDASELGPYTLPVITETFVPPPVVTEADATHTPELAHANCYIRCTNATACAITIPPNSSVAFEVATEIHYRQSAAGPLTFTAGSGVTINKRADRTAATDTNGAVVTIKKISENVWDLFGDLVIP